jgi:aminoglycoside 6'-N-acetyltransferase I
MTSIRKANKSDLNEYKRMRKLLWPECSIDQHELEIDLILSSSGTVLVAEISKSNLIGFAEISIRSDHVEGTTESPVPYLEGWYVDSEFRGKGVGKALIKSAEEFAAGMGFKELASDAEMSNKSSITIHKNLGFKEVERTVHFVKTIK